MAKQKLFDILKKYNAYDVLDTNEQIANQAFLNDFETFAALLPEAVKELAGFVKENAKAGMITSVDSKHKAIDEAATEFDQEVAAEEARLAAILEKEEAKKKGLRALKEAARKVIKARRKEEEISGKKPDFADITYKATKNQKAREESFIAFADTLQLSEARKMLFDGVNPMTITPRFVKSMEEKEEKNPDSPALKLIYERQLKTELDKAVIGRQASKETIMKLAEKLSPGAINDVMIDGKPMLTYVALNNPGMIDRVAKIEGISSESKKTALIAVAERSSSRSDYNAAVDLVANGAQAKVDDLTRSLEAMPAQANAIANLVTISSSSFADRKTLKNTMSQQIADLEKKQKSIDERDNRKNVRRDAVAGAKTIGAVIVTPFILGAVGAKKINDHFSEKKYMKRGATFVGKNIVKGTLHSPQAIAAAVSLTFGSAAVAIYYNSAKLSNVAKQSVGKIKGALHSPVELARRINLRSELSKSDKYMENMITKEFKELYEEGKKEIKVDKKDKKAYEAAKLDLKKELDERSKTLKLELKTANDSHQREIEDLMNGKSAKFKDEKTGLPITDKKQREEIVQNELNRITEDKLAFFDNLYRGQSNYESIERQKVILQDHKASPITTLGELRVRLEGMGSNRDTVNTFLSRFTEGSDQVKVAAALATMQENIKIQGERHKDYETLANESNKVAEKAMAATKSMATGVSRGINNDTTDKLVETAYQTNWDNVKDFAKGVYNTHNIPWEMAKNAVKAKPALAAENVEDRVISPPNRPAPHPPTANGSASSISDNGSDISEDDAASITSKSSKAPSIVGSIRSYFSGSSGLTAEALAERNAQARAPVGNDNSNSNMVRRRVDSLNSNASISSLTSGESVGSEGSVLPRFTHNPNVVNVNNVNGPDRVQVKGGKGRGKGRGQGQGQGQVF
jgi:hypothetical protein